MDRRNTRADTLYNKTRFLGRFPVANGNKLPSSETRKLSTGQSMSVASSDKKSVAAEAQKQTMDLSLSTSFGADFDDNFLTEMDRIEKNYKEKTALKKSLSEPMKTSHTSPLLPISRDSKQKNSPEFLTPIGKPKKTANSDKRKSVGGTRASSFALEDSSIGSTEQLVESPMFVSTPVDAHRKQLRTKQGSTLSKEPSVIVSQKELPSQQTRAGKRSAAQKHRPEDKVVRKQLKLNADHSKNSASSSYVKSPGRDIQHGEQESSPISTSQSGIDEDKLELSSWGFPQPVLEKYTKLGITRLFDWQAECLCSPGVLNGANLVYSAPTSAGKTLVAELLMLKRVVETGTKAILILPFVSVVREKVHTMQALFDDIGLRVDGYMGNHSPTGGFKAVNIAVCTIEKANSLINRLMEEDNMKLLGTLVVDELHMVGDEHRGYLLELLLTKVRYLTKSISESEPQATDNNTSSDTSLPGVQVIGMSATLPNLPLLAQWLDAQLYVTHYRPVPLTELVKIGSNLYDSQMAKVKDFTASTLIKGDEDDVVSLCLETTSAGHSVLVFCPAKNWCEKLSLTIARQFYNIITTPVPGYTPPTNSNEFQQATQRVFGVALSSDGLQDVLEQLKRSPAGVDPTLARTLPLAVAFHHAGLTFDERDIVEGAFRRGALRVLVATSTLSSGVNLPARRVIVRTPTFYGTVIDTLTYKQMVGRAGRKGIDTCGESILVCKENEKQRASQLITSALPPVRSCLAKPGASLSGSLKRAILEIVVSGVARSDTDVKRYAAGTLLSASIEEHTAEDGTKVDDCLKFLQEYEFISLKADEKGEAYTATQLGCAVLSSALGPDEGLTVFAELQRARRCFVLENDLHLLYLVTPLYMGDQLGPNQDWYQYLCMWEALAPDERRVGELVGVKDSFLSRAVSGRVPSHTGAEWRTVQVHKRFYLSLALHELIREAPLAHVSQKYKCSKGMLQSLQQAAATYAGMVVVFCRSLGWVHLELLLAAFQSRLTFGVQRELVDLVRLSLLNAQRARTLYNAGLQTVALVASAQPDKVETLLKKSVPFQSKKTGEGESEWEASERQKRQTRGIFVPGSSQSLTEAEAAVFIVEEAKTLLAADLQNMGIQWKGVPNEREANKAPVASPEPSVKRPRKSLSTGKKTKKRHPTTATPLSNSRGQNRSAEGHGNDSCTASDISSCIVSPPPGVLRSFRRRSHDNSVRSAVVGREAKQELSMLASHPQTVSESSTIHPVQSLAEPMSTSARVPGNQHSPSTEKIRNSYLAGRDIVGKKTNAATAESSHNICPDRINLANASLSTSHNVHNSAVNSDVADSGNDAHLNPLKVKTPTIKNETSGQTRKRSGPEETSCVQPENSQHLMEDSFVIDTQTLDLINAFSPHGNQDKPSFPLFSAATDQKLSIPLQPNMLSSSASPNMFSEDPETGTSFTNKENVKPMPSTSKAVAASHKILDLSTSLVPASKYERLTGEYPSDDALFADDSLMEASQVHPETNQSHVYADENGCYNSMEIIEEDTEGVVNDCELDRAMSFSLGEDFSRSIVEEIMVHRPAVSETSLCNMQREEVNSNGGGFSQLNDSFTLSMIDNAMQGVSTTNKANQSAEAAPAGQVSIDTSSASDYVPPTPPPSDHSVLSRADTPKRLLGGATGTPSKSTPSKHSTATPCQIAASVPAAGNSSKSDGEMNVTSELVSSAPQSTRSLAIIDVAANRQLFETFIQEWEEQESFSLCVACDKLPTVKTKVKPVMIGSKFCKGSGQTEVASSDTGEVDTWRVIEEEDVIVQGVAVSWQDCDAYFISLSSQPTTNISDLDESLAPPPIDTSITVTERINAICHVLNNDNYTLTSLDMKGQYKLLSIICGVELRGQTSDPLVADWLLDPGAKPPSLHRLSAAYAPQLSHLLEGIGGGIGSGSMGLIASNPSSGRVRACIEAILLHHIMPPMTCQLQEAGVLTAFTQTEMPAAITLAKMELNGMGVSESELQQLQLTLQEKLECLEQQAYSMAGHPFQLTSPDDIAQVLFMELKLPPSGDPLNPASSKTLGMPRRPGKGKPKQGFSTAKDVLEKLKSLHPIAGVVLEWRKLSMTLAKVVCPLQKVKVHHEGLGMQRIFSVSDMHTATGRVTMREPNLQNIPNDFLIQIAGGFTTSNATSIHYDKRQSVGDSHKRYDVGAEPIKISMRHVFIPYKGGLILAADYSQLELRMIAHLSGDKQLTLILNSGGDVFRTIAAQWRGLSVEEVTDKHRQQAKQVCYGMIYGLGVKALSEQLSVSEDDAAVFTETFKSKYTGMRKFLNECVKKAQDKGYVETIFGRRRYLPAIKDTNIHARAHAERQAVNTTVQGSAADLVKTAMISIQNTLEKHFPHSRVPHRSRRHVNSVEKLSAQTPRRGSERIRQTGIPGQVDGAYLLLQLHDELLYEVSTSLIHQVASVVKDKMESAMKLNVVLPVKVKVGRSWGTLEEYKK